MKTPRSTCPSRIRGIYGEPLTSARAYTKQGRRSAKLVRNGDLGGSGRAHSVSVRPSTPPAAQAAPVSPHKVPASAYILPSISGCIKVYFCLRISTRETSNSAHSTRDTSYQSLSLSTTYRFVRIEAGLRPNNCKVYTTHPHFLLIFTN